LLLLMILSNGPQTGESEFGEPRRDSSCRNRQEVREMIPLRYFVPAVLAAAATAGCITRFVTSSAHVEALPPIQPNLTDLATGALPTMDHRAGEEEKAAADFLRAAQAILRRSSNSRASFTGTDDPPITEPIPLPRKRPIPRP